MALKEYPEISQKYSSGRSFLHDTNSAPFNIMGLVGRACPIVPAWRACRYPAQVSLRINAEKIWASSADQCRRKRPHALYRRSATVPVYTHQLCCTSAVARMIAHRAKRLAPSSKTGRTIFNLVTVSARVAKSRQHGAGRTATSACVAGPLWRNPRLV